MPLGYTANAQITANDFTRGIRFEIIPRVHCKRKATDEPPSSPLAVPIEASNWAGRRTIHHITSNTSVGNLKMQLGHGELPKHKLLLLWDGKILGEDGKILQSHLLPISTYGS